MRPALTVSVITSTVCAPDMSERPPDLMPNPLPIRWTPKRSPNTNPPEFSILPPETCESGKDAYEEICLSPS